MHYFLRYRSYDETVSRGSSSLLHLSGVILVFYSPLRFNECQTQVWAVDKGRQRGSMIRLSMQGVILDFFSYFLACLLRTEIK